MLSDWRARMQPLYVPAIELLRRVVNTMSTMGTSAWPRRTLMAISAHLHCGRIYVSAILWLCITLCTVPTDTPTDSAMARSGSPR